MEIIIKNGINGKKNLGESTMDETTINEVEYKIIPVVDHNNRVINLLTSKSKFLSKTKDQTTINEAEYEIINTQFAKTKFLISDFNLVDKIKPTGIKIIK